MCKFRQTFLRGTERKGSERKSDRHIITKNIQAKREGKLLKKIRNPCQSVWKGNRLKPEQKGVQIPL